MRIILTRHGETEENIEGRFMGHFPGTLSKKGIEQAKKLALRLKDEKIDKIFSSDLARAADTAKEIAKYHKNIPIEFTQEIRERFLGEIQGVRKVDLGLNPNELVAGKIKSKEGELQEALFNRAKKFIDKIINEFDEETVLIVAHNGINLALTTNILKKTFEDYMKATPQLNCAVSIFEIDRDKNHKIHLFNCIKHLEEIK